MANFKKGSVRMSKLIILRGNSGSGKTTVANRLQKQLGENTLVVSQDIVRRTMLKTHDRENNLSINLISQIAKYGKANCDICIVEGILVKEYYGEMLITLMADFDKAYVYYFDLPFEETLVRHQQRRQSAEFDGNKMKSWWVDSDYLGTINEKLLTTEMTETHLVSFILSDIADD